MPAADSPSSSAPASSSTAAWALCFTGDGSASRRWASASLTAEAMSSKVSGRPRVSAERRESYALPQALPVAVRA
eukprot:2096243-Rhodomonas_salina.1